MGLLADLLLLPIVGPARGMRFLLEQIKEQADTEMFDERPVREALFALSTMLDLGQITEEEYLVEEEVLLARLNEIRVYQEEMAQAAREPSEDDALEDAT